MATARRIEGDLRRAEATDATTATLSGVVKRPIEVPPVRLMNELKQTKGLKL